MSTPSNVPPVFGHSHASFMPLRARMLLPPEVRHASVLYRIKQWTRHIMPRTEAPPISVEFISWVEDGIPHDTVAELWLAKRGPICCVHRKRDQFATCGGYFEYSPQQEDTTSVLEVDGARVIEIVDKYIGRFFEMSIDSPVYP